MGNVLAAKERVDVKRSNLRLIRENGGIPAVVYGHNQDSTPIEVNGKELRKTLQEVGRNGIIELQLGSDKKNVMLTEYQMDSLTNKFIHADFLAVNLTRKITAGVQLVTVGTPEGVKEGGILQQTLHEVAVTARPKELPESIEVDVSHLEIGDSIYLKDIEGQVSAAIETDGDEVVASVLAPKLEPAAEEEQAEDGEETEE